MLLHFGVGGRRCDAGRSGSAPPRQRRRALQVSVAPLNPAYVEPLLGRPTVASPSEAGSHGLGERPAPQDFSSTIGMQLAGLGDLDTLPATYDLRTLGG